MEDKGSDDDLSAMADDLLAKLGQRARPKSAAERAAEIQREHLLTQGGGFAGTTFPELGVTVRAGKVYKGAGFVNDELGELRGACAGVIDVRQPSPLAGLFTGVPPKLGRTFVRCANGQEQQRQIRAGYVSPQGWWNRARQQIEQFNAMADAASDSVAANRSATIQSVVTDNSHSGKPRLANGRVPHGNEYVALGCTLLFIGLGTAVVGALGLLDDAFDHSVDVSLNGHLIPWPTASGLLAGGILLLACVLSIDKRYNAWRDKRLGRAAKTTQSSSKPSESSS